MVCVTVLHPPSPSGSSIYTVRNFFVRLDSRATVGAVDAVNRVARAGYGVEDSAAQSIAAAVALNRTLERLNFKCMHNPDIPSVRRSLS